MRIRKNHHAKKYKYNVNRKRLNQKQMNKGRIEPSLKKYWQDKKLPGKNYYELGLSSDPNKAIPLPNSRKSRLQLIVREAAAGDDSTEDVEPPRSLSIRKRAYAVKELEEQASLRAPSAFRLPNSYTNQLIYFLKKHKLDYKAMVGDKRNHDQWTWKQFRMKIRKLRSIPKQFDEILSAHNIQRDEVDAWKEYDSDSEW